ncbi:MAG: hypothetical protein IPK82_25685 [Polyangiaceae bacterium]|nr:hypothetical protein [Polyangiaceae bacterium]
MYTRSASADESASARRAIAAREMDRPYTLAEVEAGFMALPAADVCIKSTTDCEQGEGSFAAGIHNHYRFGAFSIGAGILWATTLRSDAARGADELEREHSRSYFLVQGQFRYYALRTASWEGWVGGTIGGVVVNDSWSVKADRDPYVDTDFVGPRASTLGTEGLSAGIGVGAEWIFRPSWSVGASLRYSNWFFPESPKPLPLGDPASLSGRVDIIQLTVSLAYRIAL